MRRGVRAYAGQRQQALHDLGVGQLGVPESLQVKRAVRGVAGQLQQVLAPVTGPDLVAEERLACSGQGRGRWERAPPVRRRVAEVGDDPGDHRRACAPG